MVDMLLKLPIVEDVVAYFKSFPTHMDFEGQRRAEYIYQAIIIACAVVGFAWGFYAQRFSYTVYTLLGGAAFSCLLVLVPWPFYRRHPLSWQPVKDDSSKEKPKTNKDSKKKK